jgi:hypothetical protein
VTPGGSGVACFALLLALGSLPALPGRAHSWSASTAAELRAGTLEGTTLDEQGRLSLAPVVEALWGPAPGVVWDLGSGARGAIFVGLSSPARLLRLEEGREAAVWFERGDDALVAAVQPDERGGAWFGVSPEGRVYHARGPDEIEEIAVCDCRFVWALALTEDATLWIGTGSPGRVLARTAAGEVTPVFEAGDDPVRSLLAGDHGVVYAGTGGLGRVIRIDAGGKPFVLLDAEEPEIVALAPAGDGELWALAAAGKPQGMAPAASLPRGGIETVRVSAAAPSEDGQRGGEPGLTLDLAATAALPPRFTATVGAVLYRLTKAGDVRRLWEAPTEVPFGLAPATDGGVLVATGDRGRVWHVDERGRATVLVSILSDQASALATGVGGEILIGAATDARVERLSPRLAEVGSYLTPAVDAGTLADWGRLHVEAEVPRGARVESFVRVGNTAEPDATWSDWQQVASAVGEAAVGLPAARWLQARVDLKVSADGASPTVGRFELFFRTRNRQPVIEALAVEPPGVVWIQNPVPSTQVQGPAVADDPVARQTVESLAGPLLPRSIRKSYELGARTVTWRASDPDGDALRYRLELRAEGDDTWIPLALGIEEEFHSVDTRAMPDGPYRVRLTADDGRDNPGGTSLTDHEPSAVFLVDNTRPTVAAPRIRRERGGHVVRFVAADAGGRVATVEVSIDAGGWRPIDPEDGVADSAEEAYETFVGPPEGTARQEGPEPDRRTLRVRVTDAAGNLGGEAWPLAD